MDSFIDFLDKREDKRENSEISQVELVDQFVKNSNRIFSAAQIAQMIRITNKRRKICPGLLEAGI